MKRYLIGNRISLLSRTKTRSPKKEKKTKKNLLSINARDQSCLAVAGWETHRDEGVEKEGMEKELKRWQRLHIYIQYNT